LPSDILNPDEEQYQGDKDVEDIEVEPAMLHPADHPCPGVGSLKQRQKNQFEK
jgi:hypothetical protein